VAAGSGRIETFREIDRVEWFSLAEAARRVVAGQRVFLDRLNELLQG
jgi:predicted NUDIX family NTP pyrophosphohydrolase